MALIAGTAILILIGGEGWLANLLKPLWLGLMLAWLFAAILWAAIGVVHHAGCPAAKLGESYGTLILKLAVSIATFSINHTNGAPRFPFLLAGFPPAP